MLQFVLRVKDTLRAAIFVSLCISIMVQSILLIPPKVSASISFKFTAGGDLGMSYASNSSFRAIASSGAEFSLALGDLSYNNRVPESSYCDAVKSIIGQSYPFEIVSGNHEDGGEGHQGLIDNFSQCMPDRMGSLGVYGKEYYFDFPHGNPLARLILILISRLPGGAKRDI